MVEKMLAEVKATEYELWLSGKDNFRYDIYPAYKATRKAQYRPKWEQEVKEHLVDKWQANWSVGCEADDMVGVRQCELSVDDDYSVICHIDKDIDQIPGGHYNWPITRKGEIVSEAKRYYLTPAEGTRFFYYQLLVGDSTDNIKGCKGIGPVKAERLLHGTQDFWENNPVGDELEAYWFNAIRDAYNNDTEMLMNARCLWIWRKMNDDPLQAWLRFDANFPVLEEEDNTTIS